MKNSLYKIRFLLIAFGFFVISGYSQAVDPGVKEPRFEEILPLAEKGKADAQFLLGIMYQGGIGVSENDQEALKWFRKGAEQNHATAQYWLGKMYYEGNGVPQDYNEAAQMYRKSAEQGFADAQLSLGQLYYYGKGVPKDYVLAYMWSNLATSKSSKRTREQAFVWLEETVSANMSREQIAVAQRLARRWKPAKNSSP